MGTDLLEKVESMRNMCLARAQGGMVDDKEYAPLRRELISDERVANLLPSFLRTCRTIYEFWGFIQPKFASYRERREFIGQAFAPVLDALEPSAGSTNGSVAAHVRETSVNTPQRSTIQQEIVMEPREPKRVFVVYGRNKAAYHSMVLFLQSLRLIPRDFLEIRNELRGAPFIGNIVRAGMDRAQATIVLFTADEYSALRPSLCDDHDSDRDRARWQSRPNVLFEAGMALAIDEKRTIPVVLGGVALPSDLDGRHVIRLDNSPEARDSLRNALKAVECQVEDGGKWLNPGIAGDFEACLAPPALPQVQVHSPFGMATADGASGGRGSVHVRLGNVFDAPCDMVVLPCSAKGTISNACQAHVDRFRIPMPLPTTPGSVQVIPFPGSGSLTQWIAWAASVLNDRSTSETIEAIGRGLGEHARAHADVRLIYAPLLGAGAGKLSPEVSATALRAGFKATAPDDATLVITALHEDLVSRVRAACGSGRR